MIHLVSGAGIRTNNLLKPSLLPKPLDQGSRPILELLLFFLFVL